MPNPIRTEQIASVVVTALVITVLCTKFIGNLENDWRPDHFDEWRSLALAQRSIDAGTIQAEIPVGSAHGLARDISDRNRSLGFVAVYAGWLSVAAEPFADFKILALGFYLLYAGGLAALMLGVGLRIEAVALATLGIAALPSDPMLLGPAIAAPSSLSLGLLCLALTAHRRLSANSEEDESSGSAQPTPVKKKHHVEATKVAWASLLIAMSTLLAGIYPLSLIVFAGMVGADLVVDSRRLRTTYGKTVVALGVIAVPLFVASEWQNDARSTWEHFADLFLLDRQWHLQRFHAYRLDYLVTPPILVLAFFGAGLAMISWVHSRHGSGDQNDAGIDALSARNHLWLAVAFVVPLIAYTGYSLYGRGFIVPYQRLGLYLNLGALLCSAIALDASFQHLDRRAVPRWGSGLFALLVALAFFGAPRAAPPYAGPVPKTRPSPELEAAARRIARDFAPPSRIFSAPLDGLFLEAFTGTACGA